MEKFGKSFKRVVVGIIMTAAILITVNPVGISLASELSDLQETSEDSTENIYSNDDSGGITEQSLDDTDDFIEEDIPVLGSGVYGKELNRQGYQVQVTSYVEGAKVSTFKEGILRYQDQYVFCYNPGKRFKETDNVTIHDEVPAEFTEEQGKTISMMIYYIFNNYNLIGEEGAINYYLGQCVIWNYINSINPAFNPYRIYITDSTSAYTVEQQEAALNTILTWVDANKNDYYTSIRYWTNNDGDYQPVIFGWAYPVEKKGMIEVQKYSADTELTSDNKNYSLEGAIYGVYASEADAFLDNNRITIITTGQDGIGISGELSYDTYYVKELVSPPSYELDGNIYQVTINALVPIPVVSSAEKPYPGKIRLTKVSDNENLTNNNSSYSLEGAVYGVYETNSDAENCSNAVDTITTDKQGFGESGDLPLGTYYVKETVASKGFTLDTKVYKVDIDETVQSQTVSSYEKPQTDTAPLVVIKKDDESDDNYELLYLKDAVFEVRYYAAESESEVNEATYKRHWYLRTDSNGRAYLKSDYLTSFDDKTSDDFYYNELNEPVLPLGYITVQEVKSPEGYVLDDAVTIRKVMPGMNETQRENECIVENSEKKQSFQLIKLAEDGTSDFKPLANAGFMACKISDLSLDTEGGYIFDETKAVRLTVDGNREMFTDEDGYAISDELRYGTYLVHETTVPIGYMPVADFLITVSEDSRSPQSLIYVTDMQKKYYLRVTKIDSTTKHPVLYNSAAYKIWSYKDNDYISFKTFTGSEYEMTDTFKTDDSGVLMLPEPIT
ncbi:MAG: hypothetical protein IJ167_01110, partial [Lachnospiraceae bacterium]|nr:hypothetical protein [Lachnospiraceae bacterium]